MFQMLKAIFARKQAEQPQAPPFASRQSTTHQVHRGERIVPAVGNRDLVAAQRSGQSHTRPASSSVATETKRDDSSPLNPLNPMGLTHPASQLHPVSPFTQQSNSLNTSDDCAKLSNSASSSSSYDSGSSSSSSCDSGSSW